MSPAAEGRERESKYLEEESPEASVALFLGVLGLKHPAGLRPAVGSSRICGICAICGCLLLADNSI